MKTKTMRLADFMRSDIGMSRAANAEAWCVGYHDRTLQGFHVRRVFWGRLLAREEKRRGEQVRRAYLIVADKASR